MKRHLATFLVIAIMAVAFALPSFATGPLLGFSVIPNSGNTAGMSFGFNVASVNLEIWKADLTTTLGDWIVGLLWVPQQGNFGYRAGVKVVFDYQTSLVYDSFGFVVGVSNTWGPLQLYGDLNFLPTGVLLVIPVIGVNILFSELIPTATI